jgi:hypothetical protein
LLESNIVRSPTPVGVWCGSSADLWAQPQAGQTFAALLHARDGSIIGARLQSCRLTGTGPAPKTGRTEGSSAS